MSDSPRGISVAQCPYQSPVLGPSICSTMPRRGRLLLPMREVAGFYARPVSANLTEEMRLHLAEPFPATVEKGLDYGEVEPVLIGADIYGWAIRAGSLSELDRSRLAQAADELQRSLSAFPTDAQPYYERILRIARLTLNA